MKRLFDILTSWLEAAGLPDSVVAPLSTALATLAVLAGCGLLYFFLLKPVSQKIDHQIRKTNTNIDDTLLSPRVINAVSMLATTILVAWLSPKLTLFYPDAHQAVVIGCRVLTIAAVTYLLVLESNGFCDLLRLRNAQHSGVLVLRNLLQSIIGVGAGLLIISVILDRDLAYVISALGAMAAVLMLVFKDSILGMIAGIRLSLNNMLKVNDWIIVPKYNADGQVEDLSLTTVKVRNWDKSISNIPPHALVAEGFINKQRMLDLGVRQIRRTFYVDVNSVHTIPPQEIDNLGAAEFADDLDLSAPVVNLSLFRRWLRRKMLSHPLAAPSGSMKMQVFVREIPATPTGLPLEIFFFVKCPDWEEFELLQADFIDEVTAAFPRFGLRLYQSLAAPAFKL